MEPLRNVRHLDGQWMRQMRQPRPLSWQFLGDSEQGSAPHGHYHTGTYQQLWICPSTDMSFNDGSVTIADSGARAARTPPAGGARGARWDRSPSPAAPLP